MEAENRTLSLLPDEDICAVIAVRLKIARLRLNLTQTEMSVRSGVPLRTYKRFELSGCGSLNTFVAVLRGLDRLRLLEVILPQPTILTDANVVQRVDRIRKRARKSS